MITRRKELSGDDKGWRRDHEELRREIKDKISEQIKYQDERVVTNVQDKWYW